MHDMICFVLQFDSGIQRFMSMRATEYDHFRPTPKTSLYGLCAIVIPMLAFGYLVKRSRVRYPHFQHIKNELPGRMLLALYLIFLLCLAFLVSHCSAVSRCQDKHFFFLL